MRYLKETFLIIVILSFTSCSIKISDNSNDDRDITTPTTDKNSSENNITILDNNNSNTTQTNKNHTKNPTSTKPNSNTIKTLSNKNLKSLNLNNNTLNFYFAFSGLLTSSFFLFRIL